MNTIPLFFSPYDVFIGKFQSAHFVLFRNVRLCRSYKTVQIYFIKSSGNSVPWYFNAKVIWVFAFRDSGCCRKSIPFFFLFITNPSVFPFSSFPRPARLASQDSVSSIFLKILWFFLLDFPTVFDISPIENLSSLCNLTFSFLSFNKVTDFFSQCLQWKSQWRAGVI